MPTRASLYFQRFAIARWHKRGVLLSGLFVFFYTALCFASPEPAEHGVQPPSIAHKSAIAWPLLPGESLQNLAEKRYPQSPILQQRFLQQTLTLSRHRGIYLQADKKFDYVRLIIVPDAESLHALTHPIKKAEDQTIGSATTQGLALSFELSHANQENPTSIARLPQWLTHLAALCSLDDEYHFDFSSIKAWVSTPIGNMLAGGQNITHSIKQILRSRARHWYENYISNTALIARIPLRQLHQYPQQAMIILSAVLLLVLSIVWGVIDRRAHKV